MSTIYNRIQRRQAPAKLHTKRSFVNFWPLKCLSLYFFSGVSRRHARTPDGRKPEVLRGLVLDLDDGRLFWNFNNNIGSSICLFHSERNVVNDPSCCKHTIVVNALLISSN